MSTLLMLQPMTDLHVVFYARQVIAYGLAALALLPILPRGLVRACQDTNCLSGASGHTAVSEQSLNQLLSDGNDQRKNLPVFLGPASLLHSGHHGVIAQGV